MWSISDTDFSLAFEQCLAANTIALDENSTAFVQRVYQEGLHKYRSRLRACGFTNAPRVLDAGCGFGQWSLALASCNSSVRACDVAPDRVQFLRDMSSRLGVQNLESCVSSLVALPYADAEFDVVFCYGTLFVTPWRSALRELSRVLKRGGRIYLNANGLGWYVYLWKEQHNRIGDYDPQLLAANAMLDTLQYERLQRCRPGMNLIIEPDVLRGELRELGFVDICSAAEGTLWLDPTAPAPTPFFRAEYFGLPGCYEVVARKRSEEP